MRVWASAIAAFCAGALSVVAAPGAFGFSIDSPSVTTETDQAGANSNVTIAFDVGEPEADLRDLTIHLPPGLVGNPLAAPQCTEQQLNADDCPPASDVGDVANQVTLTVLGFLPVPGLNVQGNLYNMVPQPGEPARFGIVLNALPFDLPVLGEVLLPPIILQSPARLRQSDLGLDSVLTDLPNTATVATLPTDIDITGIELTLAGTAGNPQQGFIRLPTSCKEHTVGFSAVSYGDVKAVASTTFTTTGCENVPFSPELTAWVRPQGQGLPADFSTTISQTIEEAGLARAEVTLPQGLIGDIVVLSNTCARDAFFGSGCPPETVVGDAVATSPLQSQALSGPVNALAPANPGLPELGLDLRGALSLKLTGQVGLLPEGRVVNTFAGLPDIPIADFTLTFPRERKLIVTDDLCASNAPLLADVAFVAHSGAQINTQAPVEVRGCGPSSKRKPRASVKLSKVKSKRPALVFKARAGAKPLRTAKLKVPKALRLAKKPKFARKAKITADGDKLKGRKVKRAKRTLTVKAGGADRLRAKLRKGAVRRGGKLGKRPKFGVVLVDTAGEKTRLRVRAK